MKVNKNIALIIMTLMIMASYSVAFAAKTQTIQAYGVDTIAGYSALLSTSRTAPNEDVVFFVKKPNGSDVTIPGKTDMGGVAKVDLYDYHTRKAGDYFVSAYLKENPKVGNISSFRVYPDKVSAQKSAISAQKSVAKADGEDNVYLTVHLVDQYGNPFDGHQVNMISSRNGDDVSVSTRGATTDVNGNVTFTVSSQDSGVSIYSAVDTTSGTVLDSRAEVAFLSSSSYFDDIGGHLETFIPVAAAAGSLSSFEITDIPEFVEPNTDVSFSVKAVDSEGLTVENYTNTVHFSAEGENSSNVELPLDYTFTPEDQGEHEFSFGLKFIEEGTYKVVVTDVDNTLWKGEKNVVVSGSSGSTSTPSTSEAPVITSPVAGSYSQNMQTISGSAASNSTVKIYDNDQEIGSVQADSSGLFSYQTAELSDGTHVMYVVWLDDNQEVQGTSENVELIIDTTPPTVDDIELSPSTGIQAGDVISVKVYSEENLSQAAMVFNAEIFELSPSLDQDGLYVASFQTPDTPGEYPINVVLVDELGNEQTYESVAVANIGADGGTITTGNEEPEEEVVEEEVVEEEIPDVFAEEGLPSQVFGVIAYGSDGRVTLVWEAATDDGLVDHYKIYYGLDPLNLSDVVETKDAATTWYIPGLDNGKEYFFAVSAVDDTGSESLLTSELVSGIPFTLEVQTEITERPAEELGATEEEVLFRGAAFEERVPPEMVQNGPEILWLLFGTGFLSGVARKVSRKKRK